MLELLFLELKDLIEVMDLGEEKFFGDRHVEVYHYVDSTIKMQQ